MLSPCILFEDEHLLVANKPAGVNTHAPSLYAGEGLYDWLRHREPRWAALAIIHRLDKDTSGVMVFSKSTLANRSLTAQFAGREVRKKYLLLTDRKPDRSEFVAASHLKRVGDKYVSTGPRAGGQPAETRFCVLAAPAPPGTRFIQAEPLTGRTHQIRVHAADHGCPVLGDVLYGGTAAPRVCLHAAEIAFAHPATGAQVSFQAPADFTASSRVALREAFIDSRETTAFRVVHGGSDGWAGAHVDRLGEWLLCESEDELTPAQAAEAEQLAHAMRSQGAYHKRLTRHVRKAGTAATSPRLFHGRPAPEGFVIRENGLQFELSFAEGYSVGLFLDQRENRRRLLTRHIAADFELFLPHNPNSPPAVLNTFAYTCAFSVCAAIAGARTTSVDLSRKYLDWGKRNFVLNGLDPAAHDFIYGDAFDWLKRLTKKGRSFDSVLLDPPTFSQSKQHGPFRAEKDYGELVCAALPLVRAKGVLFASTNAAGWPPEEFLKTLHRSILKSGRSVEREQYFPQPPDFPVSRSEPAYLKTVWLRLN